jgi:hypothetical protein
MRRQQTGPAGIVPPWSGRAGSRLDADGLPVYLSATVLAFWNVYVSMAICFGLWIFWGITGYERTPVDGPDST